MSDLSNVKVGDFIYYDRLNHISKNKVLQESKLYLILEHNQKVRKSDGYLMGSKGEGKYSSFNIVHYYPETEEIKYRYRVQNIVNAIFGLGRVEIDETKITPENISSIIQAINTIRTLEKDKPKEI
jgi:hypothetical protein